MLITDVVAAEVQSFDVLDVPWLEVRPVDVHDAGFLELSSLVDPGEASSIWLAGQVPASTLLVDDRAGRLEAERRGLTVSGSIGVFLLAKQRGLIEALAPVLDECAVVGAWSSTKLVRYALERANE